MCGIAGQFSFKGKKVSVPDLEQMADAIAHRGPDDSGIWLNKNEDCGFGHRRLSIIDLSENGCQPKTFRNRYTLVFNGEIYNYIELEKWLVGYKYSFQSTSDTEVLLALYDLKKEKCLDYIDGMFAFAIWDEQEQLLFCARDRFGEKPFFFYRDDNEFLFASEIKALRRVKSNIVPDQDKLQHFIYDNNKGKPNETFFSHVQVLPAAHYMVLKKDKTQLKKYWEIDLHKKTRYIRTTQYYEHFYDLFSRSVMRRLRSDVPVGSSLSGGLDSTSIVSMISHISDMKLKTFSARFEGSPLDEGKWIDQVVKQKNILNFQVTPDPDAFMNNIRNLLFTQEYPVSSASVYAQWCVMKLAREHNVKVLLDGQGSDECLAGYDNLKYYAMWELYRRGKLIRFRREVKYMKENFGRSKSIGFKFLYDPILHLLGSRRTVYQQGYTLGERLKYAVEFELPELLRYADRNSMAHGVEVRLPFLYQQLVEFIFSIPSEQIYQKGKTKYILREALKPVLPADIYSRTDKVGFAPPENEWMQKPSFRSAIEAGYDELLKNGFTPGANAFRNYIAGNFISVFK